MGMEATLGYSGLFRPTLGYSGLLWATLGYSGLLWATLGYSWLLLATLGYSSCVRKGLHSLLINSLVVTPCFPAKIELKSIIGVTHPE